MCKQCSHKCHLHSRQDLPSLQLYNSTMAPHSTASQGSPASKLIARTAALEATCFLPSSHHNFLNISYLAKVCNDINLTPQPFLPLSHLEVDLNTTRLIPIVQPHHRHGNSIPFVAALACPRGTYDVLHFVVDRGLRIQHLGDSQLFAGIPTNLVPWQCVRCYVVASFLRNTRRPVAPILPRHFSPVGSIARSA